MTVVVHIVGGADIGVDTRHAAANDTTARRLQRLREMSDEQAAHILSRYAWNDLDLDLDHGLDRDLHHNQDLDLGLDRDGAPARTAPLTRHLGGLPGNAEVSALLLLATSSTGGTAAIAEQMAKAAIAAPLAFGRLVRSVSTIDIGDLTEKSSFPAIRAAVEKALNAEHLSEPQDLSLTWGSGATSIALAAFAAALETRAPVRLLDPDTGTELDYAPAPAPLDPRIPWYLQLGYPRLALDQNVPSSPEQRSLLLTMARRQELTDADTPRPVCLAEFIAASLRRREPTAGLALRAGIVARYQQLRGPEEPDLLDGRDEDGAPRTLGDGIDKATDIPRRRRTAAQAFLATSGHLNFAGRHAAHALRSLDVKDRAAAAALVADLMGDDPFDDELAAHGLHVLPRTPSRRVLALWAVGTRPELALGPGLLARGVGSEVLTALAVHPNEQEALSLQALLLATPQTIELAQEQAHALTTSRPEDLAHSLAGVSAQATGPLNRSDPAAVRAHLRATLDALPVPELPEVILLLPSGDKNLVLPALLASLDWAGQHGVPVFVRELTRSHAAATHQLPGYLGADAALVHAARHCVRFLDLGSAERLLRAGSHRLTHHRERCAALQAAFMNDPSQRWPPEVGDDPDSRGEALVSARLALCHHALTTHPEAWSQAERLKLVHLAFSLVEASLSTDRHKELKQQLQRVRRAPTGDPVALAARDPRQAQRTLAVLRRARNDLPIAHGQLADRDTVDRVLEAACAEYNARRTTLTRLLGKASEAATRQILPGWPKRESPDHILVALYKQLTSALEEFEG